VLDVAALTDVGTTRPHNEDACAAWLEAPDRAVLVVADGVSMAEAGEVASGMAVEVLLRAYREESGGDAGQRLYRAVQQANIEIYDRSVAVPELRGMSTTLTAAVVDGDQLTVVHVGDSRLYLMRDGRIEALTKDHTVAAGKARYGLMSKEKARNHPDRSVLTRSVGRELIVSRDRTGRPVQPGDVLLACSDGLHGVLDDAAMAGLLAGRDAATACRALIDTANGLGTPDNLSAVVLRVTGPVAPRPAPGLGSTLKRLAGF
jgi:protein phosphatase